MQLLFEDIAYPRVFSLSHYLFKIFTFLNTIVPLFNISGYL